MNHECPEQPKHWVIAEIRSGEQWGVLIDGKVIPLGQCPFCSKVLSKKEELIKNERS